MCLLQITGGSAGFGPFIVNVTLAQVDHPQVISYTKPL